MGNNEKEPVNDIAYQNKDIMSKILAEQFKGKSLKVYGLDLPDIVSAEPTNLPAVEANELRLDNLFHLADGTFAIIDYESDYNEENKCKYLNYVARVEKRLFDEYHRFVELRVIIIYTADVKRGSTCPVMDIGGNRLQITEAFLSDIDPIELRKELHQKIVIEKDISNEILMKLIIYPLTYRKIENKINAVTEAIEIAETIENRKAQVFCLSGICTFADKIIRQKDIERIGRLISMTKIEKYFADKTDEAVNKAKKEAEESKEQSADALLKEGDPVEKIARCLKMTVERVEQLKAGLQEKAI